MKRVDLYSQAAVGGRLRLVRLAIMKGEDNQAAFCRRLGLNGTSSWNNAETGDNYPGKSILDALRHRYRVGADYVLYGDRHGLPAELDAWMAANEDKTAAKRA